MVVRNVINVLLCSFLFNKNAHIKVKYVLRLINAYHAFDMIETTSKHGMYSTTVRRVLVHGSPSIRKK